MKDLETFTRHEEEIKKIKKRWQTQDRKYKKNVEHMKEYREEEYNRKSKELLDKLDKKEKKINALSKGNNQTKLKEKLKAIENMMQKETLARENVKKYLLQQELDRQNFQKSSNDKSKSYFYI